MVIRLIGAQRGLRRTGTVDVRVPRRRSSIAHHPLARQGRWCLQRGDAQQGDADPRDQALEGPGAGGIETASAVIADMAERDRDDGHRAFLQNDAVVARTCRSLAAGRPPLALVLPPVGRRSSPGVLWVPSPRGFGRARCLDRAPPAAAARRGGGGARGHARGPRPLARRRRSRRSPRLATRCGGVGCRFLLSPDRGVAESRMGVIVPRLRLAPRGETMFPSRAPHFFPGTPRRARRCSARRGLRAGNLRFPHAPSARSRTTRPSCRRRNGRDRALPRPVAGRALDFARPGRSARARRR